MVFIAASAVAIAGLPALAAGQSLAAPWAHPARSHQARAVLVCNGSNASSNSKERTGTTATSMGMDVLAAPQDRTGSDGFGAVKLGV